MQEIPLDTKVFCLDGEYGKSSHVIIEQNSQKVTHLVVSNSQLLDSQKYLVMIEYVVESSSELIQLSCTREEIALMPPFTEMRFFNPTTSKYEPLENFGEEAMIKSSSYLMWSDTSLSGDILSTPIKQELIPAGTIAVHRGASIEATDGHIGRVEEFLIDPENQHLTHLVLQEGHLWDKKELTLPMSAIARMDEDHIYLKLDKNAVKSLPRATD
ncbi:MAG: hypothetical protein RLZZ381_2611 [Cyanobacteriota bacterium]|jgi:sporulation protein YlmC with PRC-barrel domain